MLRNTFPISDMEEGMPPDVIEVVSNLREVNTEDTKLEAYAEIGVSDYVIFDPDVFIEPGIASRVYRLVERQQMDEPIWFPVVGRGCASCRGAARTGGQRLARWVVMRRA